MGTKRPSSFGGLGKVSRGVWKGGREGYGYGGAGENEGPGSLLTSKFWGRGLPDKFEVGSKRITQ